MGFLAERVVVGHPARISERLFVGTGRFRRLDETSQGGHITLAIVILFDDDPIVEEAGQEVAPI